MEHDTAQLLDLLFKQLLALNVYIAQALGIANTAIWNVQKKKKKTSGVLKPFE